MDKRVCSVLVISCLIFRCGETRLFQYIYTQNTWYSDIRAYSIIFLPFLNKNTIDDISKLYCDVRISAGIMKLHQHILIIHNMLRTYNFLRISCFFVRIWSINALRVV